MCTVHAKKDLWSERMDGYGAMTIAHTTQKMYAKQDVLVYQHNATEIFWKQRKKCEKKMRHGALPATTFFLLPRNWCLSVFVNDTQNNCPGRRCRRAEKSPFEGGPHIKFPESWRAVCQTFSFTVTQKRLTNSGQLKHRRMVAPCHWYPLWFHPIKKEWCFRK